MKRCLKSGGEKTTKTLSIEIHFLPSMDLHLQKAEEHPYLHPQREPAKHTKRSAIHSRIDPVYIQGEHKTGLRGSRHQKIKNTRKKERAVPKSASGRREVQKANSSQHRGSTPGPGAAAQTTHRWRHHITSLTTREAHYARQQGQTNNQNNSQHQLPWIYTAISAAECRSGSDA